LAMNEQILGLDVSLSGGYESDGGYDYSDAQRTPRNDGKEIVRGKLTIGRDFTDHLRMQLDASGFESEHKIAVVGMHGVQKNDSQFVALSSEWELGSASRLDWSLSHNKQTEAQREFGCFSPSTVSAWLTSVESPALRAALQQTATVVVPQALGVSPSDTCFYTDLDIESDRTDAEIDFESRVGRWRYLAGASATEINASSAQRFARQDQEQRSYRGFAETGYSLDALHLSAGIMAQDSDNVRGTEYAWRGAANWEFVTNHMLRYSYSEGFRVPSLVESVTIWQGAFCFRRSSEPLTSTRFCRNAPLISSSYDVKPEGITAQSLGYFGTFLNSRLTVDLKAFREDITNPIQSGYFFFSAPPFNNVDYRMEGAETELSFRLNDRWSIKGQYSYLDSDASASFERTLYGQHAGSVVTIFKPFVNHALSVSYYGNSEIAGLSYDRYDLAYNFNRNVFGNQQLRLQFVYQHHIGGVDGVRAAQPILSDEGHFDDVNQFYLFTEFRFQ
jgi:hypothetical protein